MTNKEIAKTAFEQVENEAREKQIATVKKIVEKTLEKIDKISKQIKELQEEKKILELDIDDLKAGKIDQIVERQEKSEKAKQTSVVVIVKEQNFYPYNPWFWPYTVIWQKPAILPADTFYCNGVSTAGNSDLIGNNGAHFVGALSTDCSATMSINCSVAKDATIGTYKVGDHTVYLR